ncbi:hypothetical protein D3C85_1221430 [compost metagenome]
MATSDAGTALVIFGRTITMATVNNTSPSMVYKDGPLSHTSVPFTKVLNCCNCDMKIITANPFTKPNITG